MVTDGTSLWVVNNSTVDKVFKYTTSGAGRQLDHCDVGRSSPTGITIDPANVSHIWIVDSGTRCVHQYNNAATLPNGSSKVEDLRFPLAAVNTNPQGIADPPVTSDQTWPVRSSVRTWSPQRSRWTLSSAAGSGFRRTSTTGGPRRIEHTG